MYDYTAYKNGTKKQVSYVDIGPGETEYMVIGVKSATRYNDETFIGMYMHYDGMYYVVVMNYNGGRYSVVE